MDGLVYYPFHFVKEIIILNTLGKICKVFRSRLLTKCDGIITNCDKLVYYKVPWTVITKCDTVYCKLRQVLQSAGCAVFGRMMIAFF